ncbi:DUF2812 domain-containing protein [Duganella sp. FT80W]|uniref:DUF2812 domain-containing protein n=1 Tax=Duganella guangzhouensis TaxID=2666084 RepID=A0A6I2KW12_9BURK|nr:DUF2812 domain-containing protein [Duganella guangzhouensis]MRW90295.1 DUF2812 domain-containing protein [Duganella guangzhouensis]
MKKFRPWWAWQDEQHGAWLQRMAAQGWYLRAANWLEIYTFERGAPAEVAYRWDLHLNNFEPDYRQLLEDAGWEYVAAHGGWHCWRKPIVAGQVPEIFSDPADRLRRYRRLLAPCVAMVVAQLLLVSQWADWGRAPLALNALNWLSLGIGAIAAYSAVQLGRRMAALKAA